MVPMSKKYIISHLPGVFHRKSTVNSSVFKKEGEIVNDGDVIGMMEIIKSFHEIKADKSGVVSRFMIEDGSPVNPGDPLLELI